MRLFLIALLAMMTACHRPAIKNTMLMPTTPPAELADYSRYVRQGVSFLAMGNEPFWSLTIQNDRQITFRTPTDSSQVPTPAVHEGAKGARTYEAANGKLQVAIRPGTYTDAMSGKVFSHTVEVRNQGADGVLRTYKGGGTLLSQLLLLNDIWVLTALNGEAVKPASPRATVPRIEPQLSEGRVTGMGGCNRISGQVRADEQFVKFGPMISTRMVCGDGTDQLEARFLRALDGTLAYRIEAGTLTLSRDGKAMMTFKKVD